MAESNNAVINAVIEAEMAKVNPGEIATDDMEALLKLFTSSFLNLIDHIDLVGLREFNANRSKPYVKGEMVSHEGVLNLTRLDVFQGAFSQSAFTPITKKNILFLIPTINEAIPPAQYAIVRKNFIAYYKLNDNASVDVDDEFEYEALDTPIGYFGEPHTNGGVYVEDMVVLANVDQRNVYLRNVSQTIMRSTDIKAEWNSGQWEFVCEAEPSDTYLVGANFELSESDNGKTFVFDATRTVNIGAIGTLRAGFKCRFISIDGAATVTINLTEGSMVAKYGTIVSGEGYAELVCYGNGFYYLNGDLISE